jgi:hypothetical protein
MPTAHEKNRAKAVGGARRRPSSTPAPDPLTPSAGAAPNRTVAATATNIEYEDPDIEAEIRAIGRGGLHRHQQPCEQ